MAKLDLREASANPAKDKYTDDLLISVLQSSISSVNRIISSGIPTEGKPSQEKNTGKTHHPRNRCVLAEDNTKFQIASSSSVLAIFARMTSRIREIMRAQIIKENR